MADASKAETTGEKAGTETAGRETADPRADEKNIKVTDRRMFTPDGELREEFRDLENAKPPESHAQEPRDRDAPRAESSPARSPAQAPPRGERSAGGRLRDMLSGRGGSGRRAEEPSAAAAPAPGQDVGGQSLGGQSVGGQDAAPPAADEPPSATFRDLVGLLAQSASVYLQQAAQLQVERRAEAVEMARLHIDLLQVVQQKTAGNLDPRESALLDDALYQLRMAFVEYG